VKQAIKDSNAKWQLYFETAWVFISKIWRNFVASICCGFMQRKEQLSIISDSIGFPNSLIRWHAPVYAAAQ